MSKISVKNLVIFLLLIVVIVGLMYMFRYGTSAPEQQPGAPEATSTQSSGTVSGSPSSPAKSSGQLTVVEERALYTSKKLYSQLVGCIGYPGLLYMQQGQKFMLENKGVIPAAVTIKSQSFVLQTNGFKIVTATESGFYDVLCNGTNALKLQIQPK